MAIPVDEREHRVLTSYTSYTRLCNVYDCLVRLQGRVLKALNVPSGPTSSNPANSAPNPSTRKLLNINTPGHKSGHLESEQHMWLDCENNGQALEWVTAKNMWHRATSRNWPVILRGLIRGAALRILISMTIWAIWKSRNKNSITGQDVASSETREALQDLLSDPIRGSWKAVGD